MTKDFQSFKSLNAAEQIFANACLSGEFAVVSKTRPTKAIKTGENANVVRAELIRWFALVGSPAYPTHAHGVQLKGAWIEDKLDFEGTEIKVGLALVHCHIAQRPNMMGMKLSSSLNLQGSCLAAGLSADRAQIAGDVFLLSDANYRFESGSVLRFSSAIIGGSLACAGAYFKPPKWQAALIAENSQIAGNVFLRRDDYNRFESTGTILLTAANIQGVLDLSPNYLHLHKNLNQISLDLSHCKLSILESDAAAWGENTRLDGFVYGSLRGADWQTKDYLAWLNKQTPNDYGRKETPLEFKPQPWRQLISVLRKMGHADIATEIAIAYEQRRYEIGKVGAHAKPATGHVSKIAQPLSSFIQRCSHWMFGKLAAYGYKPLRLLWWLFFVWLVSAMLYWCAAYHGIFTPSDALVFQNTDYALNCRAINSDGKYDITVIKNDDKEGKTLNWYTCGDLMGEYTTFSPLAYSLDVILPLVDLGQEKTWGVFIDTPKPNALAEFFHLSWNHAARLLVWFEILFGWIASLVLVAVLTGLTEQQRN